MDRRLTWVGVGTLTVAVIIAAALILPMDDATPIGGNDTLTEMNVSVNETNDTIEKVWTNETFPLKFTQYRTPVTGPRHDVSLFTPAGPVFVPIPIADQRNCLGFFDATNGTRFDEASVTITWDTSIGPETLMVQAMNLSSFTPDAQAEGSGNVTLNLSGYEAYAPDFSLDYMVRLWVPEDTGARVQVDGTFEVSYATVNGTIGDHDVGSCT